MGKDNHLTLMNIRFLKSILKIIRNNLLVESMLLKQTGNGFEIWVPQNPSFWSQPKIIFRDISEHPTFWMDKEGTIVNGDCYWLINDNDNMPENILWLVLAVANSHFIEDFYDIKFQNKLYSNRRRFITQYVEQFPIPDPNLADSKN